jgi:multiple sugar transport system substrate-binding protein
MRNIGVGQTSSEGPSGFPRRTLLRGAAGIGAAGIAGGLLAACGSSNNSGGSSGSSVAPTSGGGSTAPTSGGGGGGGDKTLTVMLASWVDPGFLNDVFQGSAAKSIGVKLKVVTVDDGTYPAQAAAAQKSGNPPDVIFWTAQGIPSLRSAGVNLLALDSYISSEDKSQFYAQDYQANTIDGKVYGLGFRCNCRGIVYHGDYAKAAGLTTPTTWTFDEFGQWATKLNTDGHTGFAFEAKSGDGRSSSNFLPLIWSTGAPLVSGAAGSWKIGFTQEQIQQVMQFYYDTVNTWHCTPKAVGTWGYPQTDENFAKGTLASYSAGPFVVPNSQKYPDTLKNLAVAPIPHANKQTTFWEEHALFIHGDSKQQDLAWQFIEAMRSEETQKLIAGRTGDAQLAVRKSVNASITDPFLKSFGALLDDAQVPEPIGIAPIMNNAVLPAIQQVTLNGTSAADAAKTLMTNMQAQLDLINKNG